ncbi:MAG: hypothetical protein IID60_05940 [Proteobacteria bacterium]|nr:hypothetical protein [Pseudomonadota bacterium]
MNSKLFENKLVWRIALIAILAVFAGSVLAQDSDEAEAEEEEEKQPNCKNLQSPVHASSEARLKDRRPSSSLTRI